MSLLICIVPKPTHPSNIDDGCKISSNLEQLIILIDKPNVRKCAIGVVYRPPNSKIPEGVKELSETVRSIQISFQGEMAIVGDFNINYNLRHSNAFKLIKEFEREFNFDQIIKTSTRITNRTSNCIDLIFSNLEYIQSCRTIDLAISDHLPTFFIKKKEKLKKTFSNFQGRSYVRYDKRSHQSWFNFWETDEEDPERLWDIILNIIFEVADIHCPYRNMKFCNDSPEWITKDMVQEIAYKDYLYNKAKTSQSLDDWNLFLKKKNEVKKLLAGADTGFRKGGGSG